MARLRQADLQAAFALVGDAYAATTVDEFVACVLPTLRALVGAEFASYATAGPGSPPANWVFDPGEPFPGASTIFSQVFPDHPFSAQITQVSTRTLKLSDFVTQRGLRQLRYYDETMRPFGANHQLATTLWTSSPEPMGVGLGFSRERGDFTERHRDLLDVLNPQLARAYAAVAARDDLHVAGLALEAALGAAGRAALLVEPPGVVVFATDAA
ncbi:MAG TPA: hypothetical protein VJ986_02250, partial [Gaiellaceae bacterium]|nr:hypothetical protein [Gaiellaceae bacterium]